MNILAQYYKENKEEFQKKRLVKDVKIFPKKRKTNSTNMLVKDGEIFLARKNKKWKHGCEQYKNLPENEKQKLVEY